MASTSPRLKHLVLVTLTNIKALPITSSIVFSHLETLVVAGSDLKEEHMHLLVSVKWPSFMSIYYQSNGLYPNAVLRLLEHAPRLKWFSAYISSNTEAFDVGGMFGDSVWPNLQGLCIRNQNKNKVRPISDQIPALQKACPNAIIHLTFKNGRKRKSRHVYGVDLPPQCDWKCHKCSAKWFA
jgi:hypothetical protein